MIVYHCMVFGFGTFPENWAVLDFSLLPSDHNLECYIYIKLSKNFMYKSFPGEKASNVDFF